MTDTAQQSEQSWTDSPALRTALLKQNKLRGKLEILTDMLAYKSLESRQNKLKAFNAASTRAVARKMLGEEIKPEGDDVGTTILGDVTNPTPVVIAGQQSSGLGPLLAAALGMLGPAGAIGGYLLNQALSKQPAAPIIQRPLTEIRQIENTQQLGVRLLRESDLKPLDIDNPAP
jgi:hypothetical protein